MLELVKSLVRSGLNRLGYRLVPSVENWNAIDVSSEPATIIDVGAATGTEPLLKRFQDAKFVFIDPLERYNSELRKHLDDREGEIVNVALGDRTGETQIHVDEGNPGRTSLFERTELTETNNSSTRETVEVRTLDELVSERSWTPPFGLKLDTEGYELKVLRGARTVLRDTDFVIVETNVKRRFQDSYKFHEMITFMRDHGFAVHNVLSAHPDRQGRVRFLDLLFVKEELSA